MRNETVSYTSAAHHVPQTHVTEATQTETAPPRRAAPPSNWPYFLIAPVVGLSTTGFVCGLPPKLSMPFSEPARLSNE
jgi:hypothetical protein